MDNRPLQVKDLQFVQTFPADACGLNNINMICQGDLIPQEKYKKVSIEKLCPTFSITLEILL